MKIPETLKGFTVDLSRLAPYARNPRRGDLAAIRESLERNGQHRPLVVNCRTMQVLAGNHTLRAAKQLGWHEIAVTFVDVDEEQAKRIALVDNRANDLAGCCRRRPRSSWTLAAKSRDMASSAPGQRRARSGPDKRCSSRPTRDELDQPIPASSWIWMSRVMPAELWPGSVQ